MRARTVKLDIFSRLDDNQCTCMQPIAEMISFKSIFYSKRKTSWCPDRRCAFPIKSRNLTLQSRIPPRVLLKKYFQLQLVFCVPPLGKNLPLFHLWRPVGCLKKVFSSENSLHKKYQQKFTYDAYSECSLKLRDRQWGILCSIVDSACVLRIHIFCLVFPDCHNWDELIIVCLLDAGIYLMPFDVMNTLWIL